MSFYLYGFIDVEERVIYIGRTNAIRRRILKEHFADNTHLPKECYLETENGLRTYPDNIQLLYRDWMYNMESEQKNIEEIIIVKNMLGDIYCANMVVVDGTCANL